MRDGIMNDMITPIKMKTGILVFDSGHDGETEQNRSSGRRTRRDGTNTDGMFHEPNKT